MGVPVFFRWLVARNPKIIKDAVEPSPEASDSGNPLIDNFYIDMNGLIHPSVNPKGQNIKIPANFDQQCENIYEYIDKLMNIIRPKRTLYLAIDGVAPRAKMNQQRSRRFRAAMDGKSNYQKKMNLLEDFKKTGAWTQEVDDYANKKSFDSNVITPGTQFLSNVCIRLRTYIKQRLQNHKLWKNLTVIFSDANCPGEGEHKIMDFIRQQRASQTYHTGQSHCIYGADADLIMLALATHEPKFYVIRQIVITMNDKFCTSCHKKGHFFMDCQRAISIQDEARVSAEMNAASINVQFQFIRIQMVREFIHINFMRSTIAFGYDIEKIIDDFVFLCFFVGNDFLPHIPYLSIRDGGIDVLLRVYEYCLSIMSNYITNAGSINLESLRIFIQQMSHHEEQLISEMVARQSNGKQRDINNRHQQEQEKKRKLEESGVKNVENDDDDVDPRDPLGSYIRIYNRLVKEEPINLDDYSVFNHRLYAHKEKYYIEKFKIVPAEFLQLKNNLSKSYIEALRWICGYYYQSVQSWEWFYPFHYSPFFSDITVPIQEPRFTKGIPFKPFQQLMAVLPSGTSVALPQFLRWYMTNISSPIIDFFPCDFVIDLIGKKFSWLGEVILPFLDEKRLLDAMQGYEEKLTEQQSYRNRFGVINLYLNKNGVLGRKIHDSPIGSVINVNCKEHSSIEGELNVLNIDKEIIQYSFILPTDRIHSISLKEGNQFDPLQQINDQFISRTDRAAFGGQRFVRLIQRSLSRRKPRQQRYDERRNDRNSPEAQREPQRQRSRQKNREHYRRN